MHGRMQYKQKENVECLPLALSSKREYQVNLPQNFLFKLVAKEDMMSGGVDGLKSEPTVKKKKKKKKEKTKQKNKKSKLTKEN